MPKPLYFDIDTDFKTLVSRSKRLEFDIALIADPVHPVTGGPYQPAMTPTQIVNDGLYESKAAKSDDPNWNTPAPPTQRHGD